MNIIIAFQLLCLVFLAGFTNAYAATPSTSNGAFQTDRIRQLIEHANHSVIKQDQVVTIILESAEPMDMGKRNMISSTGGSIHYSYHGRHEIRLPIGKLSSLLQKLPSTVSARLPFPHQAVAVTSQGVDITGSFDMQSLGVSGNGIKIGIIDLGFANYTLSQATGDLPPSSLLHIQDYTGTGTGGTNHGTNVAEIVYDMAPGSEIYLAKVASELQLQQALNDLVAAGVKIINHSVAWFGAAFYDGSGPICAITDNAQAAGLLWVNAAGNSRLAHYMSTFTDSNNNLRHEFATGQDANTINLTSGSPVTLILNWDAYPTTNVDYNLYLYNGDPDAGGNLVASSTSSQNGSRFSYPYEAIVYTPTTTTTHYIVVTKSNGSTSNLPLSLFSTGPSLGVRTTASSLPQPADCVSVLSVGATDLSDLAENFSSEGPTTDGRNKPDISAPNRTITSLTPSFAGTSGASPHAAGAAALLLAQNPSLNVTQLRTMIMSGSHDVSIAGFDFRTGYGRVSLDADMDSYNHDDDNCDLIVNIDQLDTDSDTMGNVCDSDDDNDGLLDSFELVIGTNVLLVDTDGDGLSDYLEVAFDGDEGSYDPLVDLNPLSQDTDGDSLLDASDPVPLLFNYADGDVAPLGYPDGEVNVADYVILQKLLLGEIPISDIDLAHGDLYPAGNQDGVIDLSDLTQMQMIILQ